MLTEVNPATKHEMGATGIVYYICYLVKNKFPQLPHSSGTGSNLIGHQKSHCMPWVALYVDQLRMYRYVLFQNRTGTYTQTGNCFHVYQKHDFGLIYAEQANRPFAVV